MCSCHLLSYKQRLAFFFELLLILALIMGRAWCWWRSNTRHSVSFIKGHSADGQWYISVSVAISPPPCIGYSGKGHAVQCMVFTEDQVEHGRGGKVETEIEVPWEGCESVRHTVLSCTIHIFWSKSHNLLMWGIPLVLGLHRQHLSFKIVMLLLHMPPTLSLSVGKKKLEKLCNWVVDSWDARGPRDVLFLLLQAFKKNVLPTFCFGIIAGVLKSRNF